MAIQTMQKEMVEQAEQHKIAKKGLQDVLTKEKMQNQLEIKQLRQKVEELENEVKMVQKTRDALIEDGKFAKEYLTNQQRNNVKQTAYVHHLNWQIKLKRARIEQLENSATAAAGPQDAVETADAVTTVTRRRTEKPIVRVVRKRPYAIYVIISVFCHDHRSVL